MYICIIIIKAKQMNKQLINNVRSLQQILTLGMITVEEYNERFTSLMNDHNREYKRAAQSIKH